MLLRTIFLLLFLSPIKFGYCQDILSGCIIFMNGTPVIDKPPPQLFINKQTLNDKNSCLCKSEGLMYESNHLISVSDHAFKLIEEFVKRNKQDTFSFFHDKRYQLISGIRTKNGLVRYSNMNRTASLVYFTHLKSKIRMSKIISQKEKLFVVREVDYFVHRL